MGNYSIPFIAQGVFGHRGFSSFSWCLFFLRFLPVVESFVAGLMHTRGSEREKNDEQGRGGGKAAGDFSKFSSLFFLMCFLSCLLTSSVGRYG